MESIKGKLARLFSPKAPLVREWKWWVEDRLNFLCKEFGYEYFGMSKVLLPEDFPSDFDGSAQSIYEIFEMVCKRMKLSPLDIGLKTYKDLNQALLNECGVSIDIRGASLGTFHEDPYTGKPQISIEDSIKKNLPRLIAVFAHELSHVRLLYERRIPDEVLDNELLTDLTAIFFGFGVFTINMARFITGDEYISRVMSAYALAHHAWARNEKDPPWLKFVWGESKYWCKRSIKFLFATNDTRFIRHFIM